MCFLQTARSSLCAGAMRLLATALLLVAVHPPANAQPAGLTATETRWLQGMWPVVEQAQRERMPLDIVVQPQDAPGTAPLAMAFVGGRCKLVLSLRGNPLAAEQAQRIEAGLGAGDGWMDAALALMAAHEVFGHCARHAAGRWQALPPGYVDAGEPAALDPALRSAHAQMRATQREEGYADLAALAWARSALPGRANALHRWLLAERSATASGGHHDTLAWIRLARAGHTGLAGVEAAWAAGLTAGGVHAAASPP